MHAWAGRGRGRDMGSAQRKAQGRSKVGRTRAQRLARACPPSHAVPCCGRCAATNPVDFLRRHKHVPVRTWAQDMVHEYLSTVPSLHPLLSTLTADSRGLVGYELAVLDAGLLARRVGIDEGGWVMATLWALAQDARINGSCSAPAPAWHGVATPPELPRSRVVCCRCGGACNAMCALGALAVLREQVEIRVVSPLTVREHC